MNSNTYSKPKKASSAYIRWVNRVFVLLFVVACIVLAGWYVKARGESLKLRTAFDRLNHRATELRESKTETDSLIEICEANDLKIKRLRKQVLKVGYRDGDHLDQLLEHNENFLLLSHRDSSGLSTQQLRIMVPSGKHVLTYEFGKCRGVKYKKEFTETPGSASWQLPENSVCEFVLDVKREGDNDYLLTAKLLDSNDEVLFESEQEKFNFDNKKKGSSTTSMFPARILNPGECRLYRHEYGAGILPPTCSFETYANFESESGKIDSYFGIRIRIESPEVKPFVNASRLCQLYRFLEVTGLSWEEVIEPVDEKGKYPLKASVTDRWRY